MTHYIGLMSGTSLDGVDGVLVTAPSSGTGPLHLLAAAALPFDAELRAAAMALQRSADDEIHREALLGNALARAYAACVEQLLVAAQVAPSAVRAIGVHGQTIRHRPEHGYTRQTNNPALLAELTGIDVIADFRSRDIAAGGQGAPLVPAFHQALFGCAGETRVVANIGGIGNISILDEAATTGVSGFDTGPGNMLMDAWIRQHTGQAFDAGGAWAMSGTVHAPLLTALRSDPYFAKAPPKSTGRDLFDHAWLSAKLQPFASLPAADVQATLLALTATTMADAVARYAPDALAVYVCGGGAFNMALLGAMEAALRAHGNGAVVTSTAALGVAPMHVEALAFAWLAQRFDCRLPGNLAAVTGARGARILGALYPAGTVS